MSTHGTAISLFSGAGGLDLGAEHAGFTTAAAVETDNDAADTMEKNFPDLEAPVIRNSILDVSTEEILATAGLRTGERPSLLVGGPPCTPFSKSGFHLEQKRKGLDPDASLLQSYTRVLAEAQPEAFVLENVYALTYNNRASRPAFTRLLREISAAGYEYRWEVLNSADYGVPQARPRLFVIGVRQGNHVPELPRATHTGPWEGRRRDSKNLSAHVTAGEALAGLTSFPEPEELVRGQYADLLPQVPPGDNYLYFTEKRGHPDPRFKWRSRYWSFLLKLSPTKPAPTIQAQPGPNVGPFHWENRRLRVPELQRLFTYPDAFEFAGGRSSIQSQVGNSVPPLLSQRVCERLVAVLE